MALTRGTRLGVYHVTALIGEGAMGQVYRARDTRLNRDVAIKVLPDSFAADPERLARFEREAQVLASLNHPNIAQIHGLEEASPSVPSTGTGQTGSAPAVVRALVMELVEGEDLSQRIARGQIPMDEALPIARQIADALEAAHERGIVHRDLKPANVKVKADGFVKVLDFGLAKAVGTAGAGRDFGPAESEDQAHALSHSPTLTNPGGMTAAGVILGTAAYMSPEQAKGKPVDKRADIWAFGCVLYEMLAGRRAFDGEDVTDTIVAVLSQEPNWAALPPATPAPLHRLLRRCLAKDRKARLPDIGVARMEIVDAMNASPAIESDRRPTSAPAATRSRRESLAWISAAVCLFVAAAAVASHYFEPSPVSHGVVRFDVELPERAALSGSNVAISPDGRKLVFQARFGTGAVRGALWVRALDSPAAQPLQGTEGAGNAFWAPDSRSIGFFADGKLKKIDVSGGSPQTLCDASVGQGGTWNRDGVLLFGDSVIYRVSAGGGVRSPATALDKNRGDLGHRDPRFLPDGRHFLFRTLNRDLEQSAIYLGSLDSGETQLLERANSTVEFAPPGYLLFARSGALMARPFDAGRRQWTGEALPVAEGVRQRGDGVAGFSASESGVLAYASGFARGGQLVWVSREGKTIRDFPSRGDFHTFALAPEERRAVVEMEQSGRDGADLWVIDGERGTAQRFTPDPDTQGHPVWSPDGTRIAFFNGASVRPNTLMVKDATNLEAAEAFVSTPSGKQLTDWSTDGHLVVFEERNSGTGWDLSVVPVDGDRKPVPVIRTRFDERLGQLSPDGRFMAYVSNETGREEVYVVSFPEVTEKWPISNNGASKPRWRRDGAELFFEDAAGMLTSATIARKPTFAAGVPKPMFELDAIPTDGWNYAVSADGQRILVMRTPEGAATTPISIVLNWAELLKK